MLTQRSLTPSLMVDARKQALAGEAAWNHIASFSKVIIAKGKTWVECIPTQDQKESILALALGRTGNLKAPSLQLGDQLLVGYCDALYDHYLK